MNERYLTETPSINFMDFSIQEKVQELKNQSRDKEDYIKRSYLFVRDEIPHSWDIQTSIVSRTASDVLKNKTGICWTKSCLFAGFLRANAIPSGISYQLLTRAADDSQGYIIHALNTVYIENLNKWIRLDTRGNNTVYENLTLDEDLLTFEVRKEFGEIDYEDNHIDLDERLVDILSEANNILEITIDFEL